MGSLFLPWCRFGSGPSLLEFGDYRVDAGGLAEIGFCWPLGGVGRSASMLFLSGQADAEQGFTEFLGHGIDGFQDFLILVLLLGWLEKIALRGFL